MVTVTLRSSNSSPPLGKRLLIISRNLSRNFCGQVSLLLISVGVSSIGRPVRFLLQGIFSFTHCKYLSARIGRLDSPFHDCALYLPLRIQNMSQLDLYMC